MEYTTEMWKTNRFKPTLQSDWLARCIRACLDFQQTCIACADACFHETELDPLRRCMRLALDCADICDATARIMSRIGDYDARLTRTLLDLCVKACETCAVECAKHSKSLEHCRICGEACRACAWACKQVAEKVPVAVA